MTFGFRTPSVRRRLAARPSIRRYIRHNVGLKAPRGWGWITNPRRALYNRIYNRTTFGLGDVARGLGGRRGRRAKGCLGCFGCSTLVAGALLAAGLLAALR